MSKNLDIITLQFTSFTVIPFKAEIYAENLTIEWGDGYTTKYQDGDYFNIQYHYRSEGLHQIKITGENIYFLDVSSLGLTALALVSCPNLEYLDCSGNEICELNLNTCYLLEELYCNSNNLKELILPPMNRIAHLNISYNGLERLHLKNSYALHALHCMNNKLTQIDFSTCIAISRININHNLIPAEEMKRIFQQLPTKEKCDCAIIGYIQNPEAELCDNKILYTKNWR